MRNSRARRRLNLARLEDRVNPVANDLFADAEVLTGTFAFAEQVTVDFTGEAGEPDHAGNSAPLASAWYTWTAPEDGLLILDTFFSGFDTTLAVYTGSAVDALTEVASNDEAFGFIGNLVSYLEAPVVAGTTYRIAVDGAADNEGFFGLQLQFATSAADDFADAQVLTGTSASVVSFTQGLTGEPGEPDHAGNSAPLASGWYAWTAPLTGTAYLNTFGSNFDTTLAVYTGSAVDALTEVASNDEAFGLIGIWASYLEVPVVAGTTYRIAVDGAADATGLFALNLSAYPTPPNDNFADAIDLTTPTPVQALATAGTTAGATSEPGEPDHAGVSGFGGSFPSVWYEWTAPTTGTVSISMAGSTYDTTLAVYTGDTLAELTQVAANDDFFGLASFVSFDAAAGTTYRIAVSGYGRGFGDYQLTLVNQGAPGVSVLNGVLYAVGAATNDRVDVRPDGSGGLVVESRLNGVNANQTFAGPVTAAEVYLLAGNDRLTVDAALAVPVTAVMGAGNDTAQTGAGNDLVYGDLLNNTGTGNDTIDTGAGNDSVRAGDGNNRVLAGAGNDSVLTGTGNDEVRGGDGNDNLRTGPGNDDVWGGDGNDTITVAEGNNTVFAGAGNDTIQAGAPTLVFDPLPVGRWSNVIDAGDGNDRVRVNSNGHSVVFAGAGNDDVTIGFQVGFGPDPLPPLTGSAVVFGGDGDDVLIGGAGNDLLDGGDGKDILVGGLGADVLLGGLGSDVLFDGTVSRVGGNPFSPPQLRPVFAAWDPADPASFQAVRDQIEVTPDAASRDELRGESGLDWFWSDDLLDLLDITPIEVRN